MLGVIAALPGEARCLGLHRPTRKQPVAARPGLLVALCGGGAAAAEREARHLVEAGASALLSWGVGGALQADWQPGDLLVPDALLHGEQRWTLDGEWSHTLLDCLRRRGLRARSGALWHTAALLAGRETKRRAGELSGAALADMESLGVVRAAHAAGLPAAILRAVADPLELSLPDCVSDALDEAGRWRWGLFSRRLLARPARWPTQVRGLSALAGCYRRALRALRRAAPCLHPNDDGEADVAS